MMNTTKAKLWDIEAKVAQQEEYVADLKHQLFVEEGKLQRMKAEKHNIEESVEGKRLLQEAR